MSLGIQKVKNLHKPLLLVFISAFALIASVVLFQANAATSATYYVSPSGSDTAAGTSAAPWKTLQKAIGSLSAGDTLIVKGGAYSGTVSASPNGTAAAPIVMKAAAGERPVLTGLVRLTNANYFTWDGVNVTWPSSAASSDHMFKMTNGVGWRITNSEIWGAHSYAGMLIAGTPSKWSVDHNYIHDTFASNSTNQDHLIYANGGTGGGTITRNIFETSPNGRGVKIGPPSGGTNPISNITISYNTFYNNTGPSNIQLSYGASNNKIFRNIMVKSSQGNITGYNLNGSGNVAYDNVGWDSSAVITHSGGSTKIADQGGNLHEDPQLSLSTFKPGNAKFAAYGRFASGDTATNPVPTPTPTPTPTPDTQAPSVPGAVRATATTPTQISLSWSASTDNVGVTGYNLYRNGSTTILAKVGKVVDYIDAGLTAGTAYTYQLEAVDAAGNKSAKSVAVSVTTPAAPTTPAPNADTTAPSVSITAPANNATVSGTVTVSANASDNVGVVRVEFRVDGTLVKTQTAAPFSYSWGTVGLVGVHTIDVRAADAAGNAKVASISVTANAPASPTASVTTPTGVTTKTISSGQINIAWATAPTYRVDIYRDGVKVGSTSSDSSYGDTYQLKPGTSYQYYLIARDSNGNVSAKSATVTGKTSGTATTSSSQTGSLTGKVSNSSGGAISGAKVSFKVGATSYNATTNSSGVYLLSNVPAQSAPIVYSATGYITKNDNVTVLANTTKTKNVTLTK